MVQLLSDVDPLSQQRNRCIKFIDGCLDCGTLSLLLCHLVVDRGKLSILFGVLTNQKTSMHFNQIGSCAFRWPEVGERIIMTHDCCTQPRRIKLSRYQVTL